MKKKSKSGSKKEKAIVHSKEYSIEQLIVLGEKYNKVQIAPLLIGERTKRSREL